MPGGDDYYLPDDMTNQAIACLHRMRAQDAEKPFPFTGTVKQVVFAIVPLPTMDDELAAHAAALQGRVVSGINA